jgi:hypothetical protein
VKKKLIHYALELSILEWSTTKRMANNIEEGKEEEFEFNPNIGCTFGCELLTRYGLPCKHWMYTSVVEDSPLPLSLFHPCWHFDGPAVLYSHWVMSWDPELKAVSGPSLANRYAGDWYTARGLQLAKESALAVLEKLKSLPPGMAESFANSFANSFAKGTESLLAQQDKQLASRKDFPPTLPAPLIEGLPFNIEEGKGER